MILNGFWSNPKAVFMLRRICKPVIWFCVFGVLGICALGRFWTYTKLLLGNVQKHVIYNTISHVWNGDWTYGK